MKRTGVYRIRCTVNGKVYVGSAASSFGERWQEHRRDLRQKRHHSRRLQNAWNKYGALYFVFEIVEITAPEHAVAVEQTFIDFWKASDKKHGFNICPVAGSNLGVTRSRETCEKIAAALRGKPLTEERRAKISAAHRGKKMSAESVRKRVAKTTGQTRSPEVKEKIAAAMRGKKFTPEHYANVVTANRSYTPERRAAVNAKISLSKRSKNAAAKGCC